MCLTIYFNDLCDFCVRHLRWCKIQLEILWCIWLIHTSTAIHPSSTLYKKCMYYISSLPDISCEILHYIYVTQDTIHQWNVVPGTNTNNRLIMYSRLFIDYSFDNRAPIMSRGQIIRVTWKKSPRPFHTKCDYYSLRGWIEWET